MKNLWRLIGRVGFWAAWPLLFVYLRFGRRTRVLIRCGEDLLVVKGWLSIDAWLFPGGGLHRGEDAAAGAVREVWEETGIRLEPSDLTFLFERDVVTPQKLSFRCVAYAIELSMKPDIKPAKGELVSIGWRPISELRKQSAAKQLLEPALAAWEKRAGT